MTSLHDKNIFVAGGAGNIGGSIVRGALKAGATVVTASRDVTRFDRLRRFLEGQHVSTEKLITLVGDLGDEEGVIKLRDETLEHVGALDAGIAALGSGIQPQALVEMPLSRWESVLRANLTSHFLTARAFLPPLLAQGHGAYLLVSGYGGETSWAGNAPVSIAAGGVIGLGRNLAAENKKGGVLIKPVVVITKPEMWIKFEGTSGAYQGDDVGDFMAWLTAEESREITRPADVIRYVTDWSQANEILKYGD